MALCQSSAQAPVNPRKPGELSPAFNWPGTDFSSIPPTWHPDSVPVQTIIVLRDAGPAKLRDNAKIDPGIIVHPPKSNLGVEPQATMLAQNQFPGLRFLPIEVSNTELGPIPILWPNLKLQPILIEWPRAKASLIVSPASSGISHSSQ